MRIHGIKKITTTNFVNITHTWDWKNSLLIMLTKYTTLNEFTTINYVDITHTRESKIHPYQLCRHKRMLIYSSFCLSILSPIAYWYLWHRLKLRLCLIGSHCVWGSKIANVPLPLSSSCTKAISNSTRNAYSYLLESWPVGFCKKSIFVVFLLLKYSFFLDLTCLIFRNFSSRRYIFLLVENTIRD